MLKCLIFEVCMKLVACYKDLLATLALQVGIDFRNLLWLDFLEGDGYFGAVIFNVWALRLFRKVIIARVSK